MLKELFDLIKGHADELVINNPDIPNEHNDNIIAEATNTVASGFRNLVAGGGIQNLLSLFNKGNTNKSGLLSNPIVSMMMGHFAGKLMNKFNMGPDQANQVSGKLIPSAIGSLINKTNDPNDNSFSLEKLLSSITGGKSDQLAQSSGGGLQDILGKLTGQSNNGNSDSNHGGGLMEIIKSVTGGAQQQQQQNGGGGLMDLIKGFIK